MSTAEIALEGTGLSTSRTSGRRKVIIISLAVTVLLMAPTTALYRLYCADTHHSTRESIWWPERCRSLIPPTATDITLRRAPLNHFAIYTVQEKDLLAFLARRFTEPKDPAGFTGDRSRPAPDTIGKPVGPLGCVVTADTVVYTCYASNGGAHVFYHDMKTGKTYQESAYW